jgi:hypothetical protein
MIPAVVIALIEQAAKSACSCQHSGNQHDPEARIECCYTQDTIRSALPVIVSTVLAEIRALHYPARRDTDRTPVCPECNGKAGTHPCGCWAESDLWPICGECGEQPTPFEDEDYPCPTVRLCDQIEAVLR